MKTSYKVSETPKHNTVFLSTKTRTLILVVVYSPVLYQSHNPCKCHLKVKWEHNTVFLSMRLKRTTTSVMFFSPVLYQPLFPRECHLTTLTNVRFVPGVYAVMSSEIARCQETFVTFPANIWAFTSMNSQMYLKIEGK